MLIEKERSYMSVLSIARDLDVDPDTVKRWIAKGEMSTVTIDKFKRIPLESYQGFLRRKIAASGSPI